MNLPNCPECKTNEGVIEALGGRWRCIACDTVFKRSEAEGGFSLVELLVVVAILLIIAAIAIPRLLSARAAASESAAAGTMRSISTALTAYNVKWGSFPDSIAKLGGTTCTTAVPTATASCNLDDSQAQAIAAGQPLGKYNYTYTQVASGSGFTLLGDPAPGNNASRHFYEDDGLTVHFNDTAAASASDPALGK